MDDINWFWHVSYYDDDKDLNLKIYMTLMKSYL